MSNGPTQQDIAYAIKRLKSLQLAEALDGFKPESRPTPKQWEIFDGLGKYRHRYVRAGNQSGKSAAGRRECAWVFLENHPRWKRPEAWGDEPLTMLVLGRDNKQIEESLWRGIKALLPEGSYKENRNSGSLMSVKNTENGNTILFISHENSNQAAERAQSYSAHWVWLDEMPSSWKLVEELHRRVQAKRGFFLFTMTPKVINQTIRKHVDNAKEPLAKLYRINMFDNPIYSKADKEEILLSMEGYSEAYKRTLLDGDWSIGEEMVYHYDPETMRAPLPSTYHPSWRHLLSVDPALKSKLGYSMWAEDPATGVWWNVKAGYKTDIYDPSECVMAVEKEAEGYNVSLRISDTEPWYIGAAMTLGYRYTCVHKKANRKGELMKKAQELLGTKMMLTTSGSGELEDELSSCRWSEKAAEKIVNSSSYHIIDSWQYAADVLPRQKPEERVVGWQAQLEAKHEKIKRIKKLRIKRASRSLFA